MAPKRGQKRGAAPEESKVASVLKKLHVTQNSFKQLSEALHHPLIDLPEECREMLLAGLPYSICVFQDQRHEVQETMVGMLEQALSKILGSLQLALDEENQKVAGAEATKEELDQKLQAAEEALKEAKAATASRNEELQHASEALVQAKAALTQRCKEQKEGDLETEKIIAEKEQLELSKSQTFEALKLGDFATAAEAKAAFKKFEPALKLVDMDKSLRTTVPLTLTKSPSERGSFDGMVIDELEKHLQSKLAEFKSTIAAAQPAMLEREKAVEGAQKDLTAAEESQQKASTELCTAKEAQKEASTAVSKAKEAVAAYKTEYKAATKTRNEKQAEFQAFVDGSLATFEELKLRRSKKAKVADAAEEES